MISLSSLLVDIDASTVHHPALAHAVDLAARCGARLKIVDVLPWVPASARHFVSDELERELIEHRNSKLESIARTVLNVPVTTQLLRGRPGIVLIQEVLRSGHDLLIRSHARDLAEAARPFGAIDMELMRQCPCPVWLVGREGPPLGRRHILAAVHASSANPTEEALNRTILEWALLLKDLGGARLTVLQAWTVFGAAVFQSRMSSNEFAEFVDGTRRVERDALNDLLAPFRDRLTDVALELPMGEAEDAIPRYVETHGIDLVVMGTVARTGIAGLVIGNTAERVLQRLRGSVFAIKAPGFVTPVALHSS